MMGRVARLGDRALAYVRCGKKVRFVRGRIAQGSKDTFVEGGKVALRGGRVTLGCGKVGYITLRTSRTTFVNSRQVALLHSGVTGPGILRGWIARACRTVTVG